MRARGRVFVYIEPARGYYARWAERNRTHKFYSTTHVESYWIDMLRTAPESWDALLESAPEPEAA